jgi:hypothetical protein
MKERGILFSAPMVRAILAGTKTQTRRVVRGPIEYLGPSGGQDDLSSWGWFFDGQDQHGYMVLARGMNERFDNGFISIPCPYGVPGDRLWVRETWRGEGPSTVQYRADGGDVGTLKWRPSIFMPRAYSRIDLEVTEIRVQRVQEITEEDAYAEGISGGDSMGDPVGEYAKLWDSINGKRAPWASNPWVWALTFRRVRP